MRKYQYILLSLSLTTVLGGCIPILAVGGAQGVSTATQERTAGERVDDNGIAISINSKFVGEGKDLFASVATDVVEGRVLLTGKVKDQATKNKAGDLVWHIQGVREVINEITVNPNESFGNFAGDAWISNQIRAKMLITKGIHNTNFGVQTVDSVVYLMGIAQDDHEMKVAIEISRRVSGVKRVVSHVILRDDPRRKQIGRAPQTPPDVHIDSNSPNNQPEHYNSGSNYHDNIHSDDTSASGGAGPATEPVVDSSLPD